MAVIKDEHAVFAAVFQLSRFIAAVIIQGLDVGFPRCVARADNVHCPVRIKLDCPPRAVQLHRRIKRNFHKRIRLVAAGHFGYLIRLFALVIRPLPAFFRQPVTRKVRNIYFLSRKTFQLASLVNPRFIVRCRQGLSDDRRVLRRSFGKRRAVTDVFDVVKLGKVNAADSVHQFDVAHKVLFIRRRFEFLSSRFFRHCVVQRGVCLCHIVVPVAGYRPGNKFHLKVKVFFVGGKGINQAVLNRHDIHADFRVFKFAQLKALFRCGMDIVVAKSQQLYQTCRNLKIIASGTVMRRRHRLFQYVVHHADAVPHFVRDNVAACHIALIFVAVLIKIGQQLNNVDISDQVSVRSFLGHGINHELDADVPLVGGNAFQKLLPVGLGVFDFRFAAVFVLSIQLQRAAAEHRRHRNQKAVFQIVKIHRSDAPNRPEPLVRTPVYG